MDVALASERGVRWRVSRTDRREAHRLVRGVGGSSQTAYYRCVYHTIDRRECLRPHLTTLPAVRVRLERGGRFGRGGEGVAK